MKPTLHTFLNGLIDYAGLFPPAALSLDEALRLYVGYIHNTDRWMLSRFILPASRLPDLDSYEQLLREQGPVHLSLIGRSGSSEADFLDHLSEDLEAMQRVHHLYPGTISTQVYEVKLPGTLLAAKDADRWLRFLDEVSLRIDDDAPESLSVFYESQVLVDDWQAENRAFLEALKLHRSHLEGVSHKQYRNVGFKLRCGGVEAHLFPSPERVAWLIGRCAEWDIPLKATAGLHHPFRHFNDSVQAHMYGFVNIFAASALAHFHPLSDAQIQEICVDEESAHFVFSEDKLQWKSISITHDQLRHARSHFAVSYGSCSFDEPRDDLKQLGLF